jgi:pentatricopeptide repeat protein
MEAFMEEMRRGKNIYLMLLANLRKVNLKPDLNQYTTLMDVFAKQGNIEKMKYYYEVLKAEKYTPSVITYNTLMNGYGSKGDLSNMMTVYENMRKEGAGVFFICY